MFQITGNTIQQRFIAAVNSLNLKFPGAKIAEKTGYGEPTVSAYLNKREPSEKFIRIFCEEFGFDFEEIWNGKEVNTDNPELKIDIVVRLSDYLYELKEKNRILENNKVELTESRKELNEMNDRLFAMLETYIKDIKPSLVSLSDRQHVIAAQVMAGFDRAIEIESKGDKNKEQQKMLRVYELIAERLPAHLKEDTHVVPGN